MHPRRLSQWLVLFFVVLIGGGCSSEKDPDQIRIAVVGPLSGPYQNLGKMQSNGTTKALKDINDKGGILNKPVELVHFDDQCVKDGAIKAAQAIVDSGIKYVIGHICSSATIAASDIYEAEEVLSISPASTNPQVTERGLNYVFRIVGRDDQQGPFAADSIVQMNKFPVAVLYDDTVYGSGLGMEVAASLSGDRAPKLEIQIKAGQSDFSNEIQQLISNDIQLVFFGGAEQEFSTLITQARQRGWQGQFMGGDSVSSANIFKLAGDYADGFIATQPKAFHKEDYNEKLVEEFDAIGIDPSDAFVLPSYAAVFALAESIERAQSLDTNIVQRMLRDYMFKTAVGYVLWDNKGDIKEGHKAFAVYQWHQNGTSTKLKLQ